MTDRYSQFQLSPIKAIELAAARIPGSLSLAQGIPSFATPEVIRSFVREKINAGACDKYSLTTGLPELREEIALSLQREGLAYDPESEIVVTVGSIEGITASMLACTDPGDEVLVPSPTYASYLGAIHIARCTPKFVELDEDNNFDFHVERIESQITRKTRVMLYCSPNNPTGTLFSEEKIRALVALAERHDLKLFIDEVYKDFYYTDDRHFSPVQIPDARKRVIRICSFSKAYAMTGWRVGFLHADRTMVQKLLKYHDAMVTCAPVVSQYAAVAALRYGDEFLAKFRAEFRARRDYTITRLDQLSHVLDYQMPKATYFVFPRIKQTVPLASNSHALAYDILQKVGVATVPGSAFGPSGESHLRITFGRDKQVLEEGLGRLGDYFLNAKRVERRRHTVPGSTPSAASLPRSLTHRVAAKALALAARGYLLRARPTVIGIAGTRGKTVFKRIISELLGRHLQVRSTILSYNTEIGLPLSILNLQVPNDRYSRALFPLSLLERALLFKDQASLLVLEYGVASERDAQELLSIATPDWLVLSHALSPDPSLDRKGAIGGLELLCRRTPAERILWCKDDPILESLDVSLLPARGFSSKNLEGNILVTSNGDFRVTRELVGESALQGTVAAVALAQQLAIPPAVIQDYLAPSA